MASSREDLENKLFGDVSLELEEKKRVALELLAQLDRENQKQMMLRFDKALQQEVMKSPEFLAMSRDASQESPEKTPRPQGGDSGDSFDREKADAMRKKFATMRERQDPTPPQPSQKPSVHFSGAGSPSLQDLSTKMERKYPGFKATIKQEEQTKEEALDYSFTERDCQYNGTLTGKGKGNLQVINTGDWTHRDVDEFVDHLCNDLEVKKLRIEQETVYPISMMIKACEILEARGVSLTIYKEGAPEGTPDITIDDLREELAEKERKNPRKINVVDMPLRYQEFLKKNGKLRTELVKKKYVASDIEKLSQGSEEDRLRAIELNRESLQASEDLLRLDREGVELLKDCVKSGDIPIDHPLLTQKNEKSLERKERAHLRKEKRCEEVHRKLEAGEAPGASRGEKNEEKGPRAK